MSDTIESRLDRIERRQAIIAKAIMDVIIWRLRYPGGHESDPHCGRAWWGLQDEFGIPNDPQHQYNVGGFIPRPSR